MRACALRRLRSRHKGLPSCRRPQNRAAFALFIIHRVSGLLNKVHDDKLSNFTESGNRLLLLLLHTVLHVQQ